MQSPGDVIAEQGEGAVAEQGSTADRQLWAADSLGSRAGGSSFPLPGTSVQEREESRGRRVESGPSPSCGCAGVVTLACRGPTSGTHHACDSMAQWYCSLVTLWVGALRGQAEVSGGALLRV